MNGRVRIVMMMFFFVVGICGVKTSAEGPDEAMRRVFDGLANYHPDVVWYALPSSYRDSVSDVIQMGVDAMDGQEEELYDKSFVAMQRLLGIAKKKKELFINSTEIFESNDADAEAKWDAVVGCIEAVMNSQW